MQSKQGGKLDDGTLLGNYRILSFLGSGAMAQVYLAEEHATGTVVALKLLPKNLASCPSHLRRFEREARAVSMLRHPNIVTIHALGRHLDIPFIAMEFIDGWTLRELLHQGPLELGAALDIALPIAKALSSAHDAGIVHRDLKPENVMISKQGEVKILDFGLSKAIDSPAPASGSAETLESLTLPGTILGTLEYMSPEQASGYPVGFPSDQFAVGAILYEMLTGRVAFKRDTVARTLAAVIEGREEPIDRHRSGLPRELRTLVARCLAKEPGARFRSMPWLVRQLEELSSKAQSGSEHWQTSLLNRVLAAGGLLLLALALTDF